MPRQPLYYTFGNHMHWVDMQWLWGYEVLPGSVRDMLRLIDETGARGNVNFDAVGYERMAAECPEALAALREAVHAGTIEPVGCSYGQPYGLFHGGESNVRQLTFGVRTTRRLLGVRPRTFWEEEFYFFPQLPQMLVQCGYAGACLFFQWTWHTPELPREPHSLIFWEGLDGTRLPALPRNDLNVHQWPEDFDGLLETPRIRSEPGAPATGPVPAMGGASMIQSEPGAPATGPVPLPPAIVQWLELMPSRDWMCRAEVLLPRLRELLADPRFEVRPRTASGLIADLLEHHRARAGTSGDGLPVRRYAMDDVWHGVSLGKNGDTHPRQSRGCESDLLASESIAATLGLFGRPYAGWDVYPTWELEEAWRELLAAQHHDNHECEGLCGAVGAMSFERAGRLGSEVGGRTMARLAERLGAPEGAVFAYNGTGRRRDLLVTADDGRPATVVRGVPPFGYAVARPGARRPERTNCFVEKGSWILSRGAFKVAIDGKRGVVRQVWSAEFSQGLLHPERPLGALHMVHADGPDAFEKAEVSADEFKGVPAVFVRRQARDGSVLLMVVKLAAIVDGVELLFISHHLPRSESRMHAGLQAPIAPAFPIASILADHPYGVSAVEARGTHRRKYPTGDWMTSPQVFETIARPFTALRCADLLAEGPEGRGLLCVHDGSQQFFRDEQGVRVLLHMYDAWDEDRWKAGLTAQLTLIPHGPLPPGERRRLAGLLDGGWQSGVKLGEGGDLPERFGPLEVEGAPGVVAEAFFRESMKSGEHLPGWAGHRMARESAGACTHPFVVRLVEWEGRRAEVTLKLAGPVALAAKTNVMGEVAGDAPAAGSPRGAGDPRTEGTCWLDVAHPADPPEWARGARFRGSEIAWSSVRFAMRPHEIATIMADLVMGRKQFRDLDAKREVWATVHREAPGGAPEAARS